jgi:hypothetical protein
MGTQQATNLCWPGFRTVLFGGGFVVIKLLNPGILSNINDDGSTDNWINGGLRLKFDCTREKNHISSFDETGESI